MRPENPESMGTEARDRLIDRFIPHAEFGGRHQTLVRAPADIVFDVAQTFDLRSIPMIRAIFWLRTRLLGGMPPFAEPPKGLVAETTAMGWGVLTLRPGRELVMGAVTRPWEADVEFTSLPPDRFASFSEPGLVKIVWTLEADPVEPGLTRFRTETRVLPTDEKARKKFRRYWLVFGPGILLIRLLALRAVRREASRRARADEAG